jgi:hypothetical protein
MNAMQELFEGYNARKDQIELLLDEYEIKDLIEAEEICLSRGLNIKRLIKGVQATSFNNAFWAYILGSAIAIKQNLKSPADIAKTLGCALQAFCVPGTVAEQRNVGRGHGDLAVRLLDDKTKCFGIVAGHETFTSPKSAINLVKTINRVRVNPLRVVLVGFGGPEAADVVARVNGFTHIVSKYDHLTQKLDLIETIAYSGDERAQIHCYGAESELEGVAILQHENVDVSITGNTANAVRFQHLVVAAYKKYCYEENRSFFSVASGGGTGRTLHPDNTGAGPGSFGMTDKMGRTHCDVQFAGSSSVPSHVEMMGFIGMGNNAIVAATCSVAVLVNEAVEKIKIHQQEYNSLTADSAAMEDVPLSA